jgi:hypothetical protein
MDVCGYTTKCTHTQHNTQHTKHYDYTGNWGRLPYEAANRATNAFVQYPLLVLVVVWCVRLVCFGVWCWVVGGEFVVCLMFGFTFVCCFVWCVFCLCFMFYVLCFVFCVVFRVSYFVVFRTSCFVLVFHTSCLL